MGVADRWKDWEEPRQQGGVRFRAPKLTSAVRLLLIINVAIFLLLWLGPLIVSSDTATQTCIEVFGLYPVDWAAPYLPIWQFLTYGFLHDPGSPSHLFWNMLLLYFFGTMLEEILGSRRFLTAYGIGLFVGAGLHCLGFMLDWTGQSAVVGASGAILCVTVACAVYHPNRSVLVFFIPVSLKVLVGCLVFFDIFWAVKGMSGQETGTAHLVHLGGAAFGFFGARRGWLQKDFFARFQARRAIRVEEKRRDDEDVVDGLLQKISEEGLGSLSEKEKATLKRASERTKG